MDSNALSLPPLFSYDTDSNSNPNSKPNTSHSIGSGTSRGTSRGRGEPKKALEELLPVHSPEDFLAAFSNLETHQIPDSEDEDDYDDLPWWDGVYSTRWEEGLSKEIDIVNACKAGDVDTVANLIGANYEKSQVNLNCRVPINAPNPPIYSLRKKRVIYELTPFHLCCKHGHLELVDFFIERNENRFDSLSMYKETPLHSAVSNGHLSVVDSLVKSLHIPNMVGMRDASGRTAFYIAAQENHIDIVKYLLNQPHRRKIDINEKGCKNGCTALIMACMRGNIVMVQYLLNNRMDLETPMKSGLRPLHAAVSSGSLELCKLLIDDYKADINAVDKYNRTPLLIAVSCNDLDIVTYLTECTCDLNIAYAYAYTPQEYAMQLKFSKIAFFLRDVQVQLDQDKKDRIKQMNLDRARLNNTDESGGYVKKSFLSVVNMARVQEFVKGRDQNMVDLIKFVDKKEVTTKKKVEKKG